jgi:hypothetical protein
VCDGVAVELRRARRTQLQERLEPEKNDAQVIDLSQDRKQIWHEVDWRNDVESRQQRHRFGQERNAGVT